MTNDPSSPAPPEETCWVCSKPILTGEPTASLLGLGALVVHRRCYDREVGLEPPEGRDK
jgi:hypothetical protein